MQRVACKSEIGESGQEKSEDAPWVPAVDRQFALGRTRRGIPNALKALMLCNIPPDHPIILNQAGVVGPPIAARPSQALRYKVPADFEGSFDGAVSMHLNRNVPAILDQPSGEKIVVIRVN